MSRVAQPFYGGTRHVFVSKNVHVLVGSGSPDREHLL